ncbi:MAG: WhiB family transcriptional regulator [Streptosporangiales bacterium]
MSWNESWSRAGACRDGDPDRLFVRGSEQHVAKRVCRHCPVRTECLAYALDHRMEYGVWGGMTERERRALLRRRSDVESWREVLEAAKSDWEGATPAISGAA